MMVLGWQWHQLDHMQNADYWSYWGNLYNAFDDFFGRKNHIKEAEDILEV